MTMWTDTTCIYISSLAMKPSYLKSLADAIFLMLEDTRCFARGKNLLCWDHFVRYCMRHQRSFVRAHWSHIGLAYPSKLGEDLSDSKWPEPAYV